jgi:hypothetical protein
MIWTSCAKMLSNNLQTVTIQPMVEMDGEMGVRGGVRPHAHPFRLYSYSSLSSYHRLLVRAERGLLQWIRLYARLIFSFVIIRAAIWDFSTEIPEDPSGQ